MAGNPREMLAEFVGGLDTFGGYEATQGNVEGFMNLLGTTYEEGILSTKTKELISIGIACYNRCLYCIVFHCYKSLEAGATREEILQAAMTSVAFGGGPSMAYSVTMLKESLDEFEKDFA
ncbi:MAG TPA: carboxymuconolactone decarboxylase family protein [Clostridia bacterium]|nr:carboxymuconolactone decarboxylase family protein [Clostridia bacterium]